MNGFPETYSVDPESTGQRPHDQIDNLIDEHEGSSLFNLLSFLTELAPGYSPLERMGEKETWLQKAGEVPTFLMGLGLLASPQGVRKTATKLGAKRVLQEFGEEVADPLYHNTPLTSVLDILKEGNLKGRASISFSRDPSLRTVSGKYLRETPAQIVVSKEEIKNLGKIEPKRFGGEARLWEGARAEELKGTIPSFKHEAEEVFFTPQQRHLSIKGVERARTPKRVAEIPTEKFEGIHIDKFMFDHTGYNYPRAKGGVSIPPDAIATSIRRESVKPGGNPDQPVIEYITELMREAHKRKVPIILGPEATETFEFLGMDNKLPKAWLGRLVKNSGESKEFLPLFESGPRTRKAIEILDKKKSLGVEKKTGKKFWGIIVDPLDGEIEYAIPYSKASAVGFHHSNYMPGDLAEQVTTGEKVFLFLDEKLKGKKRPLAFVRDAASWGYERRGGISGGLPSLALSPNTRLSQEVLDRIYEQIDILPISRPKLPGP